MSYDVTAYDCCGEFASKSFKTFAELVEAAPAFIEEHESGRRFVHLTGDNVDLDSHGRCTDGFTRREREALEDAGLL
jgi:hypothetical protein